MTETIEFDVASEEWTAHVDDYGSCYNQRYVAVDDGVASVCAVWTHNHRGDGLPYRQRAHLIAAAPALYEALAALDARLRECGPLHTAEDAYDGYYREIVSEALAKARGEQP